MGFRQRVGRAARNINDIMTVGFPRGEEKAPEEIIERDEPLSFNIDGEELLLNELPEGWTIKTKQSQDDG